jgi:hypothetical protein
LRRSGYWGYPSTTCGYLSGTLGGGYLGSAEQWSEAENALRTAASEVLGELALCLVEAEGEAAFYGPTLDLQVRDGRGHEESNATVQLDFSQPERFDLTYVGADGNRQRVIMIHRGILAAMERVTAALLEHYQGRLPLWLAPVQVCVMPVAVAHDEAAHVFLDDLLAVGLRARFEPDGSFGARIRTSRERRDCLIAVIGPEEIAIAGVRVTDVATGFKGMLQRDSFIAVLQRAYTDRAARIQWRDEPPGGGPAERAMHGRTGYRLVALLEVPFTVGLGGIVRVAAKATNDSARGRQHFRREARKGATRDRRTRAVLIDDHVLGHPSGATESSIHYVATFF